MKSITYNGWVNYINPATGRETRACIVSIQVTASEFKSINLAAVDPKACFRSLKGVGSSQLHAMAPIAPLIQLNKEDRRFVASADVAETLDAGTNIASIGWEEFEHLIPRNIRTGVFQQRRRSEGHPGKVAMAALMLSHLTPILFVAARSLSKPSGIRMSSAFPLSRDLYGAVTNERAIKGILVTTSSFGPDAYHNSPRTSR